MICQGIEETICLFSLVNQSPQIQSQPLSLSVFFRLEIRDFQIRGRNDVPVMTAMGK